MTARAELERSARNIVPPAGATAAIAVHDGTHHRAAFLIGGRAYSSPVGPAFDKPADACAFVGILNGDPTSRPEADGHTSASGRDAGPLDSPGPPGPDVPTLGL